MSDDKKSLINIELLPKELITNLFGPATKSIGEGLGGIVNYVVGPLRKLNVVGEKSYIDFVEKINSKTDSIPVDNRDDSKLGFALKTMEDARYQLEDEDMREYFSNLLAGLVDNRKNQDSSPRFSIILSELTTIDANLLKKLYKLSITPTIKVRVQAPNGNGIDYIENLILTQKGIAENNFSDLSPSLQTLRSYGLIDIRPSIELTQKKHTKIYEDFENSTYFKTLKYSLNSFFANSSFFKDTGFSIISIRGSIHVTDLGFLFCSKIFSSEEE
ncbi:DUF4393 domain-containing protein [Enterococcus faecalis]|uniref:DUF4393 domain-containing protein n=1 Tax=Enterococcus faecalis TaxID=1351 RepID=UPI003CC62D1F